MSGRTLVLAVGLGYRQVECRTMTPFRRDAGQA